jgi:hypothetical protein
MAAFLLDKGFSSALIDETVSTMSAEIATDNEQVATKKAAIAAPSPTAAVGAAAGAADDDDAWWALVGTYEVVGAISLTGFTAETFTNDHIKAFKSTLKSTLGLGDLSDDQIVLVVAASTRRLTRLSSRRLGGEGIKVSYTIKGVSLAVAESAKTTLSASASDTFTSSLKAEIQKNPGLLVPSNLAAGVTAPTTAAGIPTASPTHLPAFLPTWAPGSFPTTSPTVPTTSPTASPTSNPTPSPNVFDAASRVVLLAVMGLCLLTLFVMTGYFCLKPALQHGKVSFNSVHPDAANRGPHQVLHQPPPSTTPTAAGATVGPTVRVGSVTSHGAPPAMEVPQVVVQAASQEVAPSPKVELPKVEVPKVEVRPSVQKIEVQPSVQKVLSPIAHGPPVPSFIHTLSRPPLTPSSHMLSYICSLSHPFSGDTATTSKSGDR